MEAILEWGLWKFKFDSTRSQQAFNNFFTLSTMLKDLFKRPRHLVQQSFEHMLKPF